MPVACGPPGTARRQQRALPQQGRRHVRGRLRRAPASPSASGTYGLGVSTLDFDDDGWTDLYVANDSNPSALYRNNHDGTFTDIGVRAGCAYSQDGKPQAGMGVAVGDYDRNGTMDIFKTNFAGDTSTLYANTGDGFCEDRTFAGGLGLNTRWLGWGAGFVDFDNDGWLDIFLVNGHVYPEVSQLKTEAGYEQRKVVYRNLGNGRFEDVTRAARAAGHDPEGRARRGVRRLRQRRRRRRRRSTTSTTRRTCSGLERRPAHHWLTLRLVGHDVEPQRHRRARPRRGRRRDAASQEVRGGGSYLSQNDLRVHFGLGRRPRSSASTCAGRTAARRQWDGIASNRIVALTEGEGQRSARP